MGMCVCIWVYAHAVVCVHVCERALWQMCMVHPPEYIMGCRGHVLGRWGAGPLKLANEELSSNIRGLSRALVGDSCPGDRERLCKPLVQRKSSIYASTFSTVPTTNTV